MPDQHSRWGGGSFDDGPAANTALGWPFDAAVDSSGNLFIADTDNQRIRKVATDGTISTVAGTGTAGYVPGEDGGPATSAQLNSPGGVAVNPAGDIFIADSMNHRIRKVHCLAADLSLTAAPPAGPVTAGVGFGLTLTYQNAGPDAAPNPVVSVQLPSGLTFVSSTPECTGTTPLTCNLASLASGTGGNVVLNLTAPAAGSFEVTAAISTTGVIDTPANNSVSSTVTVVAATAAEAAPPPADEGEAAPAAPATGTPPATTAAPADETVTSGTGTTGEVIPPSVGGTTSPSGPIPEEPAPASGKAGGCSLILQ